MGNCGGERAICSRGWLASPPLVLLPQQEVTELLELVTMGQAHPRTSPARRCKLSSVLLLCPSSRVSPRFPSHKPQTREGIPDGMCWPTWLVVVEVLARKPRARARPLQGHWVVCLNGISGQSGSTERHVLANQGALNGMSWPIREHRTACPDQSGSNERPVLASHQGALNGMSWPVIRGHCLDVISRAGCCI
jgi:hypothetical protein